MKIDLVWVAFLVYISFALDSLLKIDLGIKVHVGIFIVLITNLFLVLRRGVILKFIKFDQRIVMAGMGLVLSSVLFSGQGSMIMLFYFFISLNVALFVYMNAHRFSEREFYWFQVILLVTGYFQYILFKLTGYQVAFIDGEHYMKGYSVSSRLRGFFIEPNWYAIAITFNTLLLIGNNLSNSIKKYKYLLPATLLAMVLNGTFATLGVILAVYLLPVARRNIIKGFVVLGFCIIVVQLTMEYRENVSSSEQLTFNHYSRLEPAVRVIKYLKEGSFTAAFFGKGLGTWGIDAVRQDLSVLVYEEKKDVRDGSEFAVMLFELGWLGVLLILVDSVCLMQKALANRLYNFAGATLLFLVCLCFYPIYKFLMYMPYYFVVRFFVISAGYNLGEGYREITTSH